jgi:hypothetical protein
VRAWAPLPLLCLFMNVFSRLLSPESPAAYECVVGHDRLFAGSGPNLVTQGESAVGAGIPKITRKAPAGWFQLSGSPRARTPSTTLTAALS